MSESPLSPTTPHGLDVLRTYGDGFAGREAELAALDQAWNGGTVRVFVLHAEGGAGKTRVVARWLTMLRDDGWRGAGRVFVHSFYSQGSDEKRNASSELFFEQALLHFGHTGPPLIDPTEQGRTLARLLVEQRGFLVLDGLEPLQHPPSFDQGRLKDPAIHSLLRSLTAGQISDPSGPKQGGLCVVTSRQPVVELQDKTGLAIVQQPLDRLDAAAGVELLRQLEVRGPEQELRQAVEDSRGHAYSLVLLGTYLRDATADHEIRRRREIPLLAEDAEHRYHARHLFGAYVQHLGESSPEVAVLRLLGFFDRPAEERLVAVLREALEPELDALTAPLRSLSPADWRRVLRRLTVLRLINVPVSATPPIDSHPLLREYFAEQLRTCFPEAWWAGHRRLFRHLCKITEHWPDTLADLQPLYQAVVHGCLAGMYRQAFLDVYFARILRGDDFYSAKKLGAIGADLGAVACFFAAPWSTLMPNLAPTDEAWVLNEAAFSLRALGRLNEAIEPTRVALTKAMMQENWKSAATLASNLSELALTRGDISEAIIAGEQALTYADRSGVAFQKIARRTALADALHQAGRRHESRSLFEDAESRQAAFRPEYSRLYSLAGFRYCDLLLCHAERTAWQLCLLAPFTISTSACDAVVDRAGYALKIAEVGQAPLLTIALDHLTLARAALYMAGSEFTVQQTALDHTTAAIDGFRAASQIDYLPLGLLTRAWLRCLSGDKSGCREDLAEAGEIAERGPMPLFQADIQLYRARLFRDRAALAEARRLIEKHGYHRRDEELADAEAAAQGWPEIQASKPPQPYTESKPGEEAMRDQVFISYSHKDKKFMEELLTHLKPYLRSGAVTAWSDQQIAPGAKWFDEIKTALGNARAAVLLVTPDFLASDFIDKHELGPFLKEAAAGGVKILWIPIRASSFEETPLKHYQAVSPPSEPLRAKSKAGRDEAWVQVCKAIKNAVNP
ncbi:MAG: TIR domain-containing protein [Thermoanaerobaculia bacterium]